MNEKKEIIKLKCALSIVLDKLKEMGQLDDDEWRDFADYISIDVNEVFEEEEG